MCPALHLYPLNDTFVPKQINLAPPSAQNRVKIGRYSNAKSVPNPLNGFFDSKVLSRAHAEVWSENDKVYIKDVKSSNGTFVNGTRLSPESQESEPYVLHTDDVVDFGIDILTDDNKEVLHHRVACRVFLVMTPEDALKLRNDFTSLYRGGVHGGALGNAGICPGAEGGLRRGKPGINFDHVIFRLQNELQKSKMVGTELTSLSTTIQNIHETLGGGVVPTQNPPYPHLVPPQGQPSNAPKDSGDARSVDAAAFASLESQLSSTHAMLASHVERIKGLESTLAAYEHITDEVANLKQQLEDTKRGLNMSSGNEKTNAWLASGLPSRVRRADDDDAASITSAETATPDVDKAEDEPKTALPDESPLTESEAVDSDAKPEPLAQETAAENAALLARIEALENKLRERDEREAAKPEEPTKPEESSVSILALTDRIAQIEQSVQAKETARPAAAQEQEQWRRTIEQQWNEQSRHWTEEQEKIKTILDSWKSPDRSREASKDALPHSKDPALQDAKPKFSGPTRSPFDSTNWWVTLGISFAICSSLVALLRS
ncbi:hypothetical protein MOBT1_002287 [Malassezia obtusa]|uniref:FHA domain-containing protein n=1 Tax=Malassezia obtusa TaxID=76774 RepID=A0AAF0E0V4_9BASI|nr:hypothetical protein MOBT1_002287 [Malassezia obtusa]